MSNLDNLVSKIVADSEDAAKKIIESANVKADEITTQYINEAQAERDRIISEAKFEAEKTKEQIILGKKLEIRDDNINAKQEMIDFVFNNALIELNGMDKKDYLKFLYRALRRLDLDGDELILPKKYEITDLDELNAHLKEHNRNGNLKLHDGERDINGGFVLVKNGIENNYTFEAMVNYYRYELEGSIIKTIF